MLEWECALKNAVDGAREGAEFIARHIIKVSEASFEAFIDQGADKAAVRQALGLDREEFHLAPADLEHDDRCWPRSLRHTTGSYSLDRRSATPRAG